MLVQPELKKWAIVYGTRSQEAFDILAKELQYSTNEYEYIASRPVTVTIQGNNFREWEDKLKTLVMENPGLSMIVLVLQSRVMKKGQYYEDLKALLNTNTNVPSQVVLAPTITRGKNVKSIVSKILVQICAKVGGCPWGYHEIPFNQKPTMVCALDLFHKKGKTSILAFVASYDVYFSRYYSVTCPMRDIQQEAVDQLTSTMESALQEFKKRVNFYPANVILYRDGVSDSQHGTVAQAEISQIEEAFLKLQIKPKLAYISVNKRIQTRLYTKTARGFEGPCQGMVVDKDIVQEDP